MVGVISCSSCPLTVCVALPLLMALDMFGDKVKARTQAELADIPVIPGSEGPVTSD